jgi:hypothetical protein
MVEALIKISGSLFIGGLGIGMILVFSMIGIVLIQELLKKWN